jgi:chromosome segregation ATPase
VSGEIEGLKSDLQTSEAKGDRQKEHIAALETRRDALEAEVDALEEVVKRLEAEGLKPLVDRLRKQITSIKTLVVAMAQAIDELTE